MLPSGLLFNYKVTFNIVYLGGLNYSRTSDFLSSSLD
jgi:hypothetical protein